VELLVIMSSSGPRGGEGVEGAGGGGAPLAFFCHERIEALLGSFALVTTMDSSLVLKKKPKINP